MKRNLLRRRDAEKANRGSYAIEFALTLPILLVILSGTIDYGWYFHAQMSVINATREAAHSGSQVDPDGIEDQGVVLTPATTALKVAEDVWTATDLPGAPNFTAIVSGSYPDEEMVVTGIYKLEPLVGFTYGFGGNDAGFNTPTTITYSATWLMGNQTKPDAAL